MFGMFVVLISGLFVDLNRNRGCGSVGSVGFCCREVLSLFRGKVEKPWS